MRKNFPFYLILLVSLIFSESLFSQKTWVGAAAGGNWNTASNWSDGAVPVSSDNVVLTTSVAMTIVLDFTTSTTINSLTITGTSNVTFTTDANRTINLGGAGTSGTALTIEASRVLTLNSPSTANVGIVINIPTNYTASINGTLNLCAFGTGAGVATGQSNQLLAADANSVQVNSGGIITSNARNNASGLYPFGDVRPNNDVIVFKSGSTFTHYGGNSPWGNTTAPNQVSKFESGSTFNVYSASTAFSGGSGLGGRFVSTLFIGCGCSPTNVSNPTATTTTIEDLTFNAGASNVTMAFFATTASTASPTYALGNIKLNQNGSGSSTATISLRNETSGAVASSYTISGNIILGASAGTQVSTLNLGSIGFGSGSGTTNITFTGANKSISVGTVGTQNLGIGGNTGTASFTTNLVINTGASLTSFRNILLDNNTQNTLTLNINSGATLTIAGNNTAFRHASTTSTFTNNGTLVIASTSAGTARIASSTGSIPGNVTVQRFIAGGVGRRKYRFLSHPFTTSQNINVLGTSVSYTGAGGTGSGFSHTTGTNNPSVFTFTTANADGNVTNDGGWSAVTAANSGTPWGVGQGLRLLVRGAYAEGLDGSAYTPSDVTVSMTGMVNSGTVNIPLVLGGSGATQDFNLIGNPYPSPVNIGTIVNASSLITNKNIYVRNPTTGAYLTRDVSNAPYTSNYTLNSLSAFFVKANAAGDLVFAEANKTTSESVDVVFEEGTNVKTPMLELEAQINGDVYDNYILKFSSKYNKGLDKDFDAVKMRNDIVNLYSRTIEGTLLGLDARKFGEQTEIPLGININSGKQTITLINTNNYLDENMEVILWDKLTNIKTTLIKDAAYTLEIDKSNSKTIGEDRLVLLLSSKTIAGIDILPTANVFNAKLIGSNIVGNNDVQIRIANPSKVATNVRVVNMLGQLMSSQEGSTSDLQNISVVTNQLQAGKYFIEVQCGLEKQSIQIVKR